MRAVEAMLVTDTGLHIKGLPVDRLVPVMEALGFTLTGRHPRNGNVREELWDMPLFSGLFLLGDRDGVARYETTAAFEMLSR